MRSEVQLHLQQNGRRRVDSESIVERKAWRGPPLPPPMRYVATALVAFGLGLSLGLGLGLPLYPDSAATPAPAFPRPRAPRLEPAPALDGVFWSERVERSLPKGYGLPEARLWRRFVAATPVVKVEEGCGRMQNRLVTFEDGTKACCRYRQNTDQIQGEVFSFRLGRLLGLTNLAPSSPALVRPSSPVWANVKSQISLSQWAEDRAVVLTEFVEGLGPAEIPPPLRNSSRRLHPPDVRDDASPSALAELAQWSDLIVFDYLTANLDRMVNNLYNLQWNSGMMEAPAHNLAKQEGSGLLVFLDNESGLLHGYRLLDKYESYHGLLLDALCVFRRSTVDALEGLRSRPDLASLINTEDPELLPALPEKSLKILADRLNRVHDRVAWCRRRYRSGGGE